MTGKPFFATILNVLSGIMTAAPFVCAVALLVVFADVRFVLGSWPVVYGDDAGDWFAMSVGLVAFLSFSISLVGVVLWAPATVLAARLTHRTLFMRRLLWFGFGWTLLGAVYALDSTGHLMSFLRYGIS
jgi:hypothetical protein